MLFSFMSVSYFYFIFTINTGEEMNINELHLFSDISRSQ